jgi:amino-acid N-acetyltransferase
MPRDRPFRRPGAEDFAALLALLRDNGLPSEDLTLASLAHFRVARADERIVAVAGLTVLGHVGLVRSVAVDPRHRAQGLATRLVAALEQEAGRLGLTTLYLLTNDAQDFFARLGYAQLAREDVPSVVRACAEFTQLCPTTASCMRKALVPGG